MNGIDVSYHQGKIDWKAVRQAGIDFAILRAGYGSSAAQKDKCFDANARGALEAGLHIGAYWFSYAVTPEDARLEARACREGVQALGLSLWPAEGAVSSPTVTVLQAPM